MGLFRLLHLYAALIWVGGMFFAYVVLRPAAVETLEAPARLSLWHDVFRRFFVWVWGAIAILLASGLYLTHLYGGMAHVPIHVHIMLLLGLIMIVVFVYVFFACYRPFASHVSAQRWQEAGKLLARIRKLVALNLTLGVVTVGVTVIGMVSGW